MHKYTVIASTPMGIIMALQCVRCGVKMVLERDKMDRPIARNCLACGSVREYWKIDRIAWTLLTAITVFPFLLLALYFIML